MTHEEFKQKFNGTTAEYALGAMAGEDSIMMIALHKENKDDDGVSCNAYLPEILLGFLMLSVLLCKTTQR